MGDRTRIDALIRPLLTLGARLRRRDDGQGMVEYALILMIITVALIIILTMIGQQTTNMFSNVSNGLGQ